MLINNFNTIVITEADWACTDGYEFAYSPAYDEIDGVKGTAPPPTGRGIVSLKDFPEPNFSTELPPPSNGKNLPNIGISLNRIIAHPDAKSPEIRAQFTKENEERKNESLTSIEKAHIAKFGSKEAEEMVDKEHKVQVAAERAQSLQEYLKGEFHTTDLEGSYYWNEVQLAFRNHGTHWETLSQDITPLGHHYLLIHVSSITSLTMESLFFLIMKYDVQFFKSALDSYRLKVFGCVKNPVILTMAQIKEMGKGKEEEV